jgi:hypothetical protein
LQIFGGAASYVDGVPTFNTGDPRWSTQPNCHMFGVNLPLITPARLGWSANQENDCLTNDTASGLGLNGRGAGYRCESTLCSNGNIDAGGDGDGLLWGALTADLRIGEGRFVECRGPCRIRVC